MSTMAEASTGININDANKAVTGGFDIENSNDVKSNNETKSASSTIATTNSTNNSDESTVLFGSTPFDIMTEFADRIDSALVDGVSSLPLLPKAPLLAGSSTEGMDDEGGDEKLMKLLRKAYFKNVDIVEAYAARNIFSIQNFPPTRRRNIMESFLSKTLPKSTILNEKEESAVDSPSSSYKYPTKDEIPSSDELQNVQEETQNLRDKLRQLRQRRAKLMKRLDSLSTVNKSVKTTNKVLQNITTNNPKFQSIENVHDSVTAMMVGKDGLEQLHRDGQDLKQKLDDKKRERSGDENDVDNDEDEYVDLQASHNTQANLTLEEEYAERRKMIKTTTEGMSKITELLKQR